MNSKKSKKKVQEECFKTRSAALGWLHAEGYKVSRGKFYQDCAAGILPVNRNGSVEKADLLQYAARIDAERRLEGDSIDLQKQRELADTRKAIADAMKAEIGVEELKRQQDQKWILREDAWAQLAALVGTIRDSLRHHTHLNQTSLVERVSGDVTRSAELYEAFDEVIAKSFNEVSSDPIECLLMEDDR